MTGGDFDLALCLQRVREQDQDAARALVERLYPQVIRIARSTNVIWRLIAEVERELTREQRRAFEVMKPKPAEVTLDVLDLPPAKPGATTPPR